MKYIQKYNTFNDYNENQQKLYELKNFLAKVVTPVKKLYLKHLLNVNIELPKMIINNIAYVIKNRLYLSGINVKYENNKITID